MKDFGSELRSGERVRRTGGVSVMWLVACSVSLVAVVLIYWLFTRVLKQWGASSPLGASFQSFNDLVFAVLTLLAAAVAAYGIVVICLRALFTQYGLTDSRVLKRSFLRLRGADLAHVQDVEVVQTIPGKLLGYGDVLVRTASTTGTIVLRRVDQPREWFREIHEAVVQGQLGQQMPS